MVIPELLAAVDALSAAEQRQLAAALTQLDDGDVIVTDDVKDVLRSRREELKANPDVAMSREEFTAAARTLFR